MDQHDATVLGSVPSAGEAVPIGMSRHPAPEALAGPLIRSVRDGLRTVRARPLVVGLDGRSGGGKTTLAATLANRLAAASPPVDVAVVGGDDFYAGGSAATWDARSTAELADRVMDWRRQRDVLVALRERGVASWSPFDWRSDRWDTDEVPLLDEPTTCRAGDVVVLEGAYSCRPELHPHLDLLVLLDPPRAVRRAQLLQREGDCLRSDWDVRWASAEDHYFGSTMTPDRFDLVLGAPSGPRAGDQSVSPPT
jgi:uridine kinase